MSSSKEHANVLSCDVLIVGSGAAGLIAAAAAQGLSVILIEQQATLGGTTAQSFGSVWMPNNPVMQALKIRDSLEQGTRYLSTALNSTDDQEKRLSTFLRDGSDMLQYLHEQGFQWRECPSSFPDYYPNVGGVEPFYRTIDPDVFDGAASGSWVYRLEKNTKSKLLSRFEDMHVSTRPLASIADFLSLCRLYLESKARHLQYRSPTTMGRSLVAQLLCICQKDRSILIFTDTNLKQLLQEGDKVVGGIVREGQNEFKIEASLGVLLATAGFSRNQNLRDQHLRHAEKHSSVEWSLTCQNGDAGDAVSLGQSVQAKFDNMDEVWGIPTMEDPNSGTTTQAAFAISKPFSIIVNQSGERFFSESQPYGDAVRAMCDPSRTDVSAWLVLDHNYRRRYTLGSLSPWSSTRQAVKTGRLLKADTVAELEKLMDISHDKLSNTIKDWNDMCKNGKDTQFRRGEDAYQRYMGDPSVHPNPCMGPIQRSPFYAVRIYPGDAGTKGGLVTDEFSRVLKADGKADGEKFIRGLYAAGNASASIFGTKNPGAGVTLCQALTQGYVAVKHMRKHTSTQASKET